MRKFFLAGMTVCAISAPAMAFFTGINTVSPLTSSNVNPFGNLIVDSAGDIFGTSYEGGSNSSGTLFEVPSGSNVVNTVASFPANSGSTVAPGAIAFDPSGNIFGITGNSIFEVAKNSSTVRTVATFTSANGSSPEGPIVFDSAGNLYGTTNSGNGGNGFGTVFELPKNSTTITTVASFNGYNGSLPNSLVIDSAGNIYGTTDMGGATSNGTYYSGYGSIFKIPAQTNTIQTILSFSSNNEGPSNLIRDAAGNFYGITAQGGQYSDGTVFELPAGASSVTNLATFNESTPFPGTGYFPTSLIADSSGNLFGATEYGGSTGAGTAFEVTADHANFVTDTFDPNAQGSQAVAELASDAYGDIFGATTKQGPDGDGAIFMLPAPEPGAALPVSVVLLSLLRRRS